MKLPWLVGSVHENNDSDSASSSAGPRYFSCLQSSGNVASVAIPKVHRPPVSDANVVALAASIQHVILLADGARPNYVSALAASNADHPDN